VSADADEIATAVQFHRSRGATTIISSLVSDTIDNLSKQVRALTPFVRSGDIAGIHLEGPWISTMRAGAHDRAVLTPPNMADLEHMVEVGEGAIRMVTLAPELPGAMEAIDYLVSQGLVVAIGHTDCDSEQARQAVAHGASVVTHAFNAMPSIHHREPGPLPWLLSASDVFVELIADGVHVHPEILEWAIATVGSRRAVLVTDAMAAAGCLDGDYVLGSQPVHVADGSARVAGGQALAGSTLTMDAAVRLVNRQCGVSLSTAAGLGTSNPARALKLDGVGALEVGMTANVIGMNKAGEVELVVYQGEILRSSA